MSGVTRSVRPLVPIVKRRLKSISSRAATLALNPTRRARRPERLAIERDVVQHGRARRASGIELDEPHARRVDRLAAQEVERHAELVGQPDVGAGGLLELVRHVGLLSRLGIAGEDARPVPLVGDVDVRREPLVRPRRTPGTACTPGAPDPSRFRSSPVGIRTSKPSASPRRDSRITPAFTRTIEVAEAGGRAAGLEGPFGSESVRRVRIAEEVDVVRRAGADASTIVAAERTSRCVVTSGTASETSSRSVTP